MDAGPDGVASTQAFVTIGAWLRENGLQAPRIFQDGQTEGLLILEDLGKTDVATHVDRHPDETEKLYKVAVDALVRIESAVPPLDLPAMTPDVGGAMLNVTTEWYAGAGDETTLAKTMAAHLETCCGAPTVVALRDYHAENLIWRPEEEGAKRLGLLDFQDAFLAPRGYDLVSLLRDVRRRVDPAIRKVATAHFTTATGPFPRTAFACLSVQRNLRILGVFARLALREGKTRYLRMIPHIWAMVSEDLTLPELAELRNVVRSVLPPPERSRIKDLL